MASQNGKRTYACPYCGALGFKKRKLKTHVEAVHNEHFKEFMGLFKAMK